jgi:hypothetical protein
VAEFAGGGKSGADFQSDQKKIGRLEVCATSKRRLHPTAIHPVVGARDEGGVVGCQKSHQGGDFLRKAQALERHILNRAPI